jgi:hypothetical protein
MGYKQAYSGRSNLDLRPEPRKDSGGNTQDTRFVSVLAWAGALIWLIACCVPAAENIQVLGEGRMEIIAGYRMAFFSILAFAMVFDGNANILGLSLLTFAPANLLVLITPFILRWLRWRWLGLWLAALPVIAVIFAPIVFESLMRHILPGWILWSVALLCTSAALFMSRHEAQRPA